MLFLVAVVQSNIYDVLIVALPGLIAAISSVVMGIINSKKTNDNKIAINSNNDAIKDNITATNENKDALHKISKEVNGNLKNLIEAKEKIAYTEGANSTNINNPSDISYQLNKIWIYLKDRALAECIVKGFINSFNEQLIISEEIKNSYKDLIPELKNWYQENKNLNDLELFKECEYKFGQRIVEQVCKFHQISNGSCIQIAVILAKEE